MSKTGKHALTALVMMLGFGVCADAALAQQPTDAQKAAIRNNCRSDFMANCMGVSPGGVEAFQCLQRHSASLSSACRSAVAAIAPKPAPAATPAPAPASPAPAAAPAPSHSATPAPAPAPSAAPAAAPASPSAAPAAPKQAAPAAPPAAKSAASPPRQPTGAQKAAIRQACQTDFLSRCPGVPPGGAQALQCLQGHAPELSAGCRSALAAIGGVASASVAPPAAAPAPAADPPIGPLPLRFRMEILNICRAERMQLCGGMPPGGGRILDCLVANQASISPGCRRALVWAATGQ
jgi:hypothetical protein